MPGQNRILLSGTTIAMSAAGKDALTETLPEAFLAHSLKGMPEQPVEILIRLNKTWGTAPGELNPLAYWIAMPYANGPYPRPPKAIVHGIRASDGVIFCSDYGFGASLGHYPLFQWYAHTDALRVERSSLTGSDVWYGGSVVTHIIAYCFETPSLGP